ncbi:hypothetical protein H9P43_000466 [Blastocladiella emersonii ATCC 22665]|nr:hypothetical protein H9P43_000466 [Blastocladiella emersonii ATCC 22665]
MKHARTLAFLALIAAIALAASVPVASSPLRVNLAQWDQSHDQQHHVSFANSRRGRHSVMGPARSDGRPRVPFLTPAQWAAVKERAVTLKDVNPPAASLPPVVPVFSRRSEFRVRSLPGIDLRDDEYRLYAGHLLANDKNSAMFFAYWERRDASPDLVVWLNGGPGSSSLFGMFVENGPITMSADGTLSHNEYGWHKAGNALFLENPAGVGFSTVTHPAHYVKTIHDVGREFVYFAHEFSRVFDPKYALQWHITGESFAGFYIPYAAQHILDDNYERQHGLGQYRGERKHRRETLQLPDHWIDFLASEDLLLDPARRAELLELRARCFAELGDREAYTRWDLPHCAAIEKKLFDRAYFTQLTNGTHCLPTNFDVRVRGCDERDPTDAPADAVAAYLNRPDVIAALHGGGSSWRSFNDAVFRNLNNNGDLPSADVLPELVARGVRVLLYAGDRDFICNHVGHANLLDNMNWGRPGYKSPTTGSTSGAEFAPFGPRGFGHFKSERGLTYLRVFEAGYMVPFNQPSGALAMILAFVQGEL